MSLFIRSLRSLPVACKGFSAPPAFAQSARSTYNRNFHEGRFIQFAPSEVSTEPTPPYPAKDSFPQKSYTKNQSQTLSNRSDDTLSATTDLGLSPADTPFEPSSILPQQSNLKDAAQDMQQDMSQMLENTSNKMKDFNSHAKQNLKGLKNDIKHSDMGREVKNDYRDMKASMRENLPEPVVDAVHKTKSMARNLKETLKETAKSVGESLSAATNELKATASKTSKQMQGDLEDMNKQIKRDINDKKSL